MAKEIQRETIRQIALRAKAMGGRAMLVGGCVRDALLGRESADIDCEVYGLTPEQLHALAAQFGTVDESGARYGIFTLKDAGIDLELCIRDRSRVSHIFVSVSMLICLPFPMLAIMFVVRPAASRKSSFLILRSFRVRQSGW